MKSVNYACSKTWTGARTTSLLLAGCVELLSFRLIAHTNLISEPATVSSHHACTILAPMHNPADIYDFHVSALLVSNKALNSSSLTLCLC